MDEIIDITIVGAGVIGVAVARALTAAGHQVVVLEKNPGVTQGENQSSRNSGVIHAGLYYDSATRPLKAWLCPRGNQMLYDFCARHDVPALQVGKLIVATGDEEKPTLYLYAERAQQNGVPARLISREEATYREPAVRSVGALMLPTSGIIDPTTLVRRLYALASAQGAQFLTSTELTAAQPHPEGLACTLRYRDGAQDSFLTRLLINCAGLYSDEVARLVNPASPYRIDPMRGEAACFQRRKRPEITLQAMNVYPTPYLITLPGGSYWTVGVHLTPTLEPLPDGSPALGSTVTVGPLNLPARHKDDYGGPHRPMAEFHQHVAPFLPGLLPSDLQPHQVGIQARLIGHHDWVIKRDPAAPACLNLLGIDSPGLTGCLAIAEYVRQMVES